MLNLPLYYGIIVSFEAKSFYSQNSLTLLYGFSWAWICVMIWLSNKNKNKLML
jgi:hypothetical protein